MKKDFMLKKMAALIIGLALPFLAISQESDLGNWLIYIGNKKINKQWNIHHEVQYRNYNVISDLEQLLLRTGVGHTFNKGKNNVLLGYGFILSENYSNNSDDKETIREHRIFQQFISKQQLGSLNLSHRYRFEQRFIEDDFKMRFRYFLGFNLPLSKKVLASKTYYLSVYNELFLNTKSSVFDRNRLFGGIGYKLNESVKFELGYMNQIFESNSRDQINILAFISL